MDSTKPTKTKRLSLTALWMMSHPDDTPPPRGGVAAAAWRKKRFLNAKGEAEREKYEALMAEQRSR